MPSSVGRAPADQAGRERHHADPAPGTDDAAGREEPIRPAPAPMRAILSKPPTFVFHDFPLPIGICFDGTSIAGIRGSVCNLGPQPDRRLLAQRGGFEQGFSGAVVGQLLQSSPSRIAMIKPRPTRPSAAKP